jgi:uncharacterized protein (TIGR02569 family)
MTDAPAPPPPEVLAAFGVPSDAPTKLAGGEGKAWRAGAVVLKPETEVDVVTCLAASVEQVPDSAEFRLARHVAGGDGRFVVDGWAATTWVEGAHGSERWDEVLAASRHFHAAIASIGPPAGGIARTDTQWSIGDRVAWREQGPAADVSEAIRAVLDKLGTVLDAAWHGVAPQVIHGDIGGNVLFADDLGLPPAVIDMSPYVRPAPFADAIAVVDAIGWEGAPITLAFRFGTTVENGEQLLARAVVYRLIAASEAWRAFPERVAAEVDAYRPILSAIRT